MKATATSNERLSLLNRSGFETPTDLARAIAKGGQETGYSGEISLASTLNQIFRGTKDGRFRPCPATLLEPILSAVRIHMAESSSPDTETILAKLESALTKSAAVDVPRCETADFRAVLREARGAESIVAVLQPDWVEDPCGKLIVDVLVDRLDMRGDATVSGPKVLLFFSNREAALRFWRSLLDHVARGSAELLPKAKARLGAISTGLFIVKVVPEQACAVKGIFFNVDDGSRSSTGFHIYFRQGMPTLCSIPEEEVSWWRLNVHVPIKFRQMEWTETVVDVQLSDAIPACT